MKKTDFLLLAVLITFSGIALATSKYSATAGAAAGASSQSGAIAAAIQGQHQSVTVTTVGSTPSTSVTRYPEQTPDVSGVPIAATAPCYVGGSATVGVPGFAASVGGFRYDEECAQRELVRIAHASRNPDVQHLADALLEKKLYEALGPSPAPLKVDEISPHCFDWEVVCE